MHKPVVVMVTVSNRVPYLNAFLRTLVKYAPDYPIHIHMQDPGNRADEVEFPAGLKVVDFKISPDPMGCDGARIQSQRWLADFPEFDTYVNADDDVALTPYTYWDPMVDYVHKPGVGFMLTAWAKHVSQFEKMMPGIHHGVDPQVMVYNGGGMLYGNDVAELIRAREIQHARYDDMWPLTAYLAGYMNGVYRGSLTLHQTISKGGMQSYMAEEPRPLLGWKWIDYKRGVHGVVGADYDIGMDKDLKSVAHEEHRAARAVHGWEMNKIGTKGKLPAVDPIDSSGVPTALESYFEKQEQSA